MAEANQTEQATPRRREKAREKGQIARSRDLIGAASGMAATFVLFSLMSSFPLAWRGFFHDCLEGAVSGNLRMEALTPFLTHSGLFVATGAALALGWIVALSSALAQGGLVFARSICSCRATDCRNGILHGYRFWSGVPGKTRWLAGKYRRTGRGRWSHR